MAVMQALLKIKADVTGEGNVDKLGRALGGLQGTAAKVSGGLKGMLGAAGGLSGALGALAPAVTGVGLVAMAKSAIDAADDMNDLAQKTGVSVEQLSRFKQAADASGTSVEAVGGAMLKLGRNMATGNDGAAQALKELEISATDASGKLRTTDQVMLDVADRFAKMEDGGKKSALAVQLFGKAGADMIPLLNGGRDAVEGLSATMSTKFAQGADQLNDKMVTLQTGLTQLGVTIGTALMPVLNVVADAVVAVATGFAALPAPLQTIIGGVVALTAAFVVLAPAISAVAPLIVGFQAALTGLLAWISGTFLPALIAFFSGPVGWTVLAVAAVVAMAILFREPIMEFLTWLGEAFMTGLKFVGKLAYDVFLKPWVELFKIGMRAPISEMWKWLQETWTKGVSFITTTIGKIADAAKAPFLAVVNTVRSAFNSVLSVINNGINYSIDAINRLIAGFNRLPPPAPDLPYLDRVSIPQFAEGGVVDRPTLGVIGEGGEREYIIPESKMGAAASAYLGGARGGSVLSPSTINVQTGPVLQQGGQTYVTVADLQRAMRATEAGTLARIRTPAGRTALGIR